MLRSSLLYVARRALCAAVFMLTLAASIAVQAASYTYTANSQNLFGPNDPRRNLNWHNEFNWEPQGIPTGGDSATIVNDGFVFLDQPVTVQNLTLASGDANPPDIRTSPSNSLTVTGTLNWSEGNIGFSDPGNLIIPCGRDSEFARP